MFFMVIILHGILTNLHVTPEQSTLKSTESKYLYNLRTRKNPSNLR